MGSFKAQKITNDKVGYEFKYPQESEYNNERIDQTERWGASEASNEERRPGKGKKMTKPSTSC